MAGVSFNWHFICLQFLTVACVKRLKEDVTEYVSGFLLYFILVLKVRFYFPNLGMPLTRFAALVVIFVAFKLSVVRHVAWSTKLKLRFLNRLETWESFCPIL